MTCVSLFSGVGGIDLGFELAGFKTIYANEFDSYVCDTFEANFALKVDRRDVRDVPACDIPNSDVLLAGFPCQAFSIAGLRKGFHDQRGSLFFEIIRMMKEKQPRVALFENVKNLVSHDNGNTFATMISELEMLGYKVAFKVLNATEFGIPQNRERIYILAFRDGQDWHSFEFPSPAPLTMTIKDMIDFDACVDNKYYYTPKCRFYDELRRAITCSDAIFQWRRVYVRKNKNNMVPTLTANMGAGGHNVPLILTSDGRIRKLTPRECFNCQGFPSCFVLPAQSDARLYKQAGNSVAVSVIHAIALQIGKVIK